MKLFFIIISIRWLRKYTKKVLGSRLWLSDVYSQSHGQDGTKTGPSIYSTPNAGVDEFWACAVLEYVPVTSVKLAVHFCDHAATLQLCKKAEVNNPESLQKSADFLSYHLFCKRGIFWWHAGTTLIKKIKCKAKFLFHSVVGKQGWPFLLSGGNISSILYGHVSIR